MRNRAALSAFALGLTLAVSASALDRQSALGAGGEIFTARMGTKVQLFPQAAGPDAGNPTLALDVVRADATVERLIVPGTDDEAVESSPFLVYEQSAGALFMVWQRQQGFIHPVLNVVCFKNGQFGKVIEVSGNPSGFSDKSASQIAVTRDEYAIAGEDGEKIVHRMVLHLIWWESDAKDDKILYSPLTLLDGAFAEPFELYTLNDLDTGAAEPSIADVAAELYRAPRIQSGRNDHTVVVAFANPRTGRLVTAEISVLPGEISYLGDDLRTHIIEIGARAPLPNATQLGDVLRTHIIEIGHRTRLNRDVLQYLGGDLRTHIIEIGNRYKNDPKGLAEVARERLIRSGANLLENGLDRAANGVDSGARIVELGDPGEPTTLGTQLIQFQVAATRPAPRTANAPTTLYASEDGRKVLVAWELPGLIRYREADGDGWSKLNTLLLGDNLTRERADQILERRVRH